MKYLSLYLYPQDVRTLLREKFQSVAAEKKRLSALLQADIDAVTDRIESAQEHVDEFKTRGLPTMEELEREANKPSPTKEALRAWKEAQKNVGQGQPYLNKDLIQKNHEGLRRIEADLDSI